MYHTRVPYVQAEEVLRLLGIEEKENGATVQDEGDDKGDDKVDDKKEGYASSSNIYELEVCLRKLEAEKNSIESHQKSIIALLKSLGADRAVPDTTTSLRSKAPPFLNFLKKTSGKSNAEVLSVSPYVVKIATADLGHAVAAPTAATTHHEVFLDEPRFYC